MHGRIQLQIIITIGKSNKLGIRNEELVKSQGVEKNPKDKRKKKKIIKNYKF